MNKIFHIDCDAFYASCEELRNPNLKKFPMAVGGLSNKSIITTANYKAREYGIHSAMPVFIAKQLCPDLIMVKVDRKYYKKKSIEVFDIIESYSHTIEQVSIDEAYIFIDNNEDKNILAQKIQNQVLKKTGIGVSIGISYNKFLAKLASDWNKPMGIKEISKEEVPEILKNLDIKKVHGLGNKSVQKLKDIGVYKIADLLKLDQEFLQSLFGKQGRYVYKVIRGEDNRKVQTNTKRKSIGREFTFRKNTKDLKILYAYIDEISQKIEEDLKAKDIKAYTINLKIKTEYFKTHTKSYTLLSPISKKEDIAEIAKDLLDQIISNENLRLIGISLSNLSKKNHTQLSLFDK